MLEVQQQTLSQFNQHLDELFENFNNCELEISTISEYDDSEIVYITKKLEEIIKQINIHTIKVPDEQLMIHVQPDLKLYETLQAVCKSRVKFKMLPITLNGQEVSLRDYALPPNYWLCTNCESLNTDSYIQCLNCSTMRGIESYPNLIHNPEKVNDFEKKQLRHRRQLERALVCARDLLTTEVVDTDKCFYLINSEWLTQWKAFIFNKPIPSSRISQNMDVGVLPPGPISNYNLLMKDHINLKKGLQKNIDYRGVNEYVWEIYHRFYGGGPIIARNSLDIYSERAANSRYLSLCRNPTFYRQFENRNKELLELLLKLKKIEKDESQEAERDEISKRIRTITRKNKPEHLPSEVAHPPKPEPPSIVKTIFSLFSKQLTL